MYIHPKSSSVPSRVVVLLGVFMAVAVTLLSCGLLAWRYNQVVTKATADLVNVSSLLMEQSNQAFQSIDVIQNQLIDNLRSSGANSADTLVEIAGQKRFHEDLRASVEAINSLDAASVIDSRGNLLNYSRGWPIPKINVADRDYFHALASSDVENFWSGPIRNRGNGAWTIYYARRFEGADKTFGGIVLGMISVEKLEQRFANITLPPESGIALYRSDGVMLVSNPPASKDADAAIAPDLVVSPYMAQLYRRNAPGDDKGIVDGDKAESITAIRKLADYPLMIAANSPRAAVLSGWWREVAIVSALALTLDLTIAVAGLLGLRQLRASDRAFRRAQHAARHDVLTGLPNRTFFNERLEELAHCAPLSGDIALLLLDLNHFKEVNDSFGHSAGDELLKVVAERLLGAIGPGDFLARLGGDEFAILHRLEGPVRDVNLLALGIVQSLFKPIRLTSAEVQSSCCIGYVVARAGEEGAIDQLVVQADMALYRAKEEGRTAVCGYSEQMCAERVERLALQRDLDLALSNSEMLVYFQPIIDIRAACINGFEALARWKHPKLGFVSPQQFIAIAEESGQIARLGAWVLAEACRQAATWPDDISVAVNLSPVQLRVQEVYATVLAVLKDTGLPSSRLVLEITESVELHRSDARMALDDLHAIGVRIALDDFGTGYASLSYLQSFPFDVIKIDQSFIKNLNASVQSDVIVQTVLRMATRLGMKVTAEGVETLEQLKTLASQGCDKAQGYLMGRPMPAGDVHAFLAEWRYPGLDAARPVALGSH